MTKDQGGLIDKDDKIEHSSWSSLTMESSAGFTQPGVTTDSNESRDRVGDCSGPSGVVVFSQPTAQEERTRDVLQNENSSSIVTHSGDIQDCVQGSSSHNTSSHSTVASVDFMDEGGDVTIADLDTTDVNPSVDSCSTDRSISHYRGTSRNASVDLSTVNMDEIGDAIIAELDESTFPSGNTSTNVDSNELSRTTLEHATMDAVDNSTHNSDSVFMDETEDSIIAELDIRDIDFCSKDNQENAQILKNSAMTAEMEKQEFTSRVDSKLTKNLSQLTFLGRIIGAAICEGFFINLHLCKPLVKQILGVKLNHPHDLSSFDYELHKNYVTFVLESDNVENLELPCTLDVLNPWNERLTALTLFPDQRNEELLNGRNKDEYVNLVSQHKLTILIKNELDALCQGLYEVIPKSLFSLFTADEFSLLINGVGKIDVEDWQKNTQYTPRDAAITKDEIKWFWEVVNELKEEEKALLLKFSTGSPCLPAGGFSQLQGLGGATLFHISMKSEWNKIPTASTCFNQLKLPKYDNIKDLKDKLLIAIRHGTEGFSFS